MSEIKPWIVCAAIKRGEVIITGARHFDMIMQIGINLYNASIDSYGYRKWEQGFIDQLGKFYSRTEAFQIVKESGQSFNAERNGGNGKDLYSEGLY